MRDVYTVKDAEGNTVTTCAEYDHAYEYVQQQTDAQGYTIEHSKEYTVKGLGRDPDLH